MTQKKLAILPIIPDGKNAMIIDKDLLLIRIG